MRYELSVNQTSQRERERERERERFKKEVKENHGSVCSHGVIEGSSVEVEASIWSLKKESQRFVFFQRLFFFFFLFLLHFFSSSSSSSSISAFSWTPVL